eukprot:Nk52_evm32s217 gene=Nk52_evmTU32s217
MNGEEQEDMCFDLSGLGLSSVPEHVWEKRELVYELDLSENPDIKLNMDGIAAFSKLNILTLRGLSLNMVPGFIADLKCLRKLDLSCNRIEYIPRFLFELPCLEELSLGGNLLSQIPEELLKMKELKVLWLGGNKITSVPECVSSTCAVEFLFLNGNNITEIPKTISLMKNLKGLCIGSNQLASLPYEIVHLSNLVTLDVSGNQLKTLPVEILGLKNLENLSVRNNPFVTRFVSSMNSAPSLREISGRYIISKKIDYDTEFVPKVVVKYLNSSKLCENPDCGGVYFESAMQKVVFVDFCGKYRLPLKQFICSSHQENFSETVHVSEDAVLAKLRKAIMGKYDVASV